MTQTNRIRFGATLPLVALFATPLLAGCHKDNDDAATSSPPPVSAPAPAPTAPAGPSGPAATTASPGGPGGTMMNTQSTNPNGAPGDTIITMKVKSALIADKSVKASAINVDTKSNTVVLRGTQPTQAGITAAMADAKKMQGVKNVINQLTVKP